MLPVLKSELHNFDKYVQVVPTGSEQGNLNSSKCRLFHVAGAFLHRDWIEKDIREENVRWIFGPLASYFDSVFGSRANHSLWVLPLFYYLLWRLYLLQSLPLAVQAYCLC
jgi:hypothetical protein